MVREVDRIMFRYGLEFVILDVRQQPPRKLNGTETLIRETVIGKDEADLVIDKAHIERRIVCNEYGIADKFKKVVNDIGKPRSIGDHLVVDAGKGRNKRRNTRFGIYERLERVLHLEPLHTKGSDLGYAMRFLCSRGLEIEDDELRLGSIALEAIVRGEYDGVFAQFEPRVAFDQIADKQLCHQGVGTPDLHHEVHDADGRRPAVK